MGTKLICTQFRLAFPLEREAGACSQLRCKFIEATPSAVCIDSQSVKTTDIGGEQRGYDGGKKIKGRKRHLLVDTLGLPQRTQPKGRIAC